MDIWDARLQVAQNNLLIAAMLIKLKRKREMRKRCRKSKYLKDSIFKERCAENLVNMVRSPEIYIDKFHMSNSMFLELFDMLEPHLLALDETHCDNLPPKVKWGLVLEFFATDNVRYLTTAYGISVKILNQIIDAVCKALEIAFKNEFPVWESDTLLQFAEEFEYKWNFPNCVGALGVRHIAVKTSTCSGYDSDSTASILLVAVADASYRFTHIDVQTLTKDVKEANVFPHSDFGKNIIESTFDFPKKRLFDGKQIPYFLVGNESFPHCNQIIMPYSIRIRLKKELVFNYRLCRAQACAENALGILSWKWRCLNRSISCAPERAHKIARACCLLHNYFMRVSKAEYAGDYDFSQPRRFAETIKLAKLGRIPNRTVYVRDALRDYFNSERGAIRGQVEAALKKT